LDIGTVRTILDSSDNGHIEPGQPFLLQLLASIARESGDADHNYPLLIGDGVPLGVTEATLRSPGIWPTKEELSGMLTHEDAAPSPEGHEN
jgi:hypothetical protein